jgi:hypothetical protein
VYTQLYKSQLRKQFICAKNNVSQALLGYLTVEATVCHVWLFKPRQRIYFVYNTFDVIIVFILVVNYVTEGFINKKKLLADSSDKIADVFQFEVSTEFDKIYNEESSFLIEIIL